MAKTNGFKLCAAFGVAALILIVACSTRQDEPRSSVRAMQTSPIPRSASEKSSTKVQPIRAVDFANFTFPYVDDLGDSKQSFTLQRGEITETGDKVGMILESVVYGDVTGDGADEAMVVLSVITGGSAIPHVVYVYTLQDEIPKLLWAFSMGDRADGGLRKVYAESNELVVERYGKDGITADCCPNIFTRTRYEWRNSRFEQKGGEETLQNPEGHGTPVMPKYRSSD